MNRNSTKEQFWYNYADLFILISLCLLLLGLIYLIPNSSLRVLVGTLYIFYAPGYALLAALYPEQLINHGQRFFSSLGLSMVITGLLNLAATYYIGTNLRTSFSILTVWIVMMTFIAGYRRYLTPLPNRFILRFNLSVSTIWQQNTGVQKGLLLAQIIVILFLGLAAGRLIWVSSQNNPQFAEFYLLGKNGVAGNYTKQVFMGTPVVITLGIVNHGKDSVPYELFVRIDDEDFSPITNIVLNNQEQWVSDVTFYPQQRPGKQKVTFVLKKSGESFPYRMLYFWLDVQNQEEKQVKSAE